MSKLPRRLRSADAGGAAPASGGSPDAAEPKADGIERRRHPRVQLDAGTETVASALRSVERRQQTDRRGTGGLRDNVGWTVAADRGNRVGNRFRIKKSRIYVLGIAILAGGFAAYLAIHVGQPSTPSPAVAAARPASQVLVASQHIAAGQRISAASLAWKAWPEQALQPDYITASAMPAATTDLDSFMARSEFLPGDPIRRQKLTEGAGGFLSAALDKGMRGVSVVVTAESASGGFISPNDHVDVVLTRPSTAGVVNSGPHSETILRNVRVLAINTQAVEPGSLGPSPDQQRGSTFTGQATATLALDPKSADLVVSAAAMGKLSLLLRPAAEADKTAVAQDAANQSIRMSSPFWRQ